MARTWKRIFSTALIAALVIALLPLSSYSKVQAAGEYFTFNDYSTVESDPTDVGTKTISVSGSFTAVTPDSITFKVEKIVGSDVTNTSSGSTRPIISGNDYLFSNVELFDGLNKITLSGYNTNGSLVEGASYVYFGNVPVITSIALTDGRALTDGGPLYIIGPTERSILIKAINSTTVTVNGVKAFSGGGESFTATNIDLQPGLNSLAIVADSGGKTYSQTRQVIYFDGSPTAYNVKIGSDSLDGHPTLPGTSSALISGKLIFELPLTGAIPPNPGIFVTLGVDSSLVTNVTGPTTQGRYAIFDFTTQANATAITANGEYAVQVTSDSWATKIADFSVPFRVRDANAPYVTGIKQLYNVTLAGTAADSAATYTDSTNFPESPVPTVPKTPLWLEVDAANFDIEDTTAPITYSTDLKAYVNGVDAGSAFAKTQFISSQIDPVTGKKQRIYRIDNMPAGNVELRFSVIQTDTTTTPTVTKTDTVSRFIQFLPVPSIQLTSIYDGQQFTSQDGIYNLPDKLKGKLLNFNLATDKTIKMTMNGISTSITADAAGVFSLADQTKLKLVSGPNRITLAGTANGVPVTTTVTVYYFSTDTPSVTNIVPLPTGAADDSDHKFISSGTRGYTTQEKTVDVKFLPINADKIIIKVDGTDFAKAELNSTIWTIDHTDRLISSPDWRVAATLPESGARSITITAVKGATSFSETITITREYPSFEVLSPKLPQEAVVNQNFLSVSIRAEDAKRIVLGKEDMVKGEGDIFRLDYQGLKPGVNKIKFTVYQSDDGKVKLNGDFSVNYAGDSSMGAQYKATVPKSGKLSVFNGDLTLSFPKNTFLQQVNVTPGVPSDKIDLFDSQEILFGIADKTDGRTIKSYNRVGEQDGTVWKDGEIVRIAENDTATAILKPLGHYGYASNLYWIDAGYAARDVTDPDGYKFVPADHPYKVGGDYTMFFNRPAEWWLEPSQRGDITIQYDESLRNVAANDLSIWKLHGQKWENIGGIVNTSKKTVTAKFDGFGYYTVMTLNYSYNDIVSHGYARDDMELLLARGIMEAKDSNEFGAYDSITRGEFAQMLVKMTNIPLDYDEDVNKLTFSDVPLGKIAGTLWDYRYIETAVRKGIIRGKAPRLFYPNDPLSREEAAVMIARATNLLKGKEDPVKDAAALQKKFTDANQVGYYATSSVLAINKAGYIEGLPNTVSAGSKATFRFDPRANLSRADASVITVRVMKKAKLL